jgi:hypothetical protein
VFKCNTSLFVVTDLNQQQLFGNSFTTDICLLMDIVMDSGVSDFS